MKKKHIGDRPLSLAVHLKSLAVALDAGTLDYCWSSCPTCNCGLLIRALTGWTKDELWTEKHRGGAFGIWREVGLGKECDFLAKMKTFGLEREDFVHVENLNNARVGGMFVTAFLNRSGSGSVAFYFRRWAKKIEAYRKKHPLVTPPLLPTVELSEAALEALEMRELIPFQHTKD